jgi:leader peptidase (prepilin peptidase)/N-methyltransferase
MVDFFTDMERWYHLSDIDWVSRWGLVYPGVWIFVIFWVFAFGACIGSFLNVCIWRIPRGESLSKASSHCTVCGNPIRWYDNIPIVSYLVLRGRCRACKTPYSCTYFIVELITGVLTALVAVKAGLAQQYASVIPAWMLLVFFGMTCAVTDLRFRIVPDKLTFTGMIFALLAAALLPAAWGVEVWWRSLLFSLISGIAPALFLAIFAILGKLIAKRDVLGWGDIKFTMMCGMFTGLFGIFFALLAASFTGTVFGLVAKRKLNAELPFAPFIFGGALLWIFCDRFILDIFTKFVIF